MHTQSCFFWPVPVLEGISSNSLSGGCCLGTENWRWTGGDSFTVRAIDARINQYVNH